MLTQRITASSSDSEPAPATPISPLARVRMAAKTISTQEGICKPAILLLDDEERILKALKAIFRFKYRVLTATEGAQALDILRGERIHVVVSDQRMPTMTGVDFLKQAREISPSTMRILLTGFSDLPSIIGSVNDGEVYRFINKPWGNKEIEAIVDDAVGIANELFEVTPVPMRNDELATPSVSPVHAQAGVLVLDEHETAFHHVTATMGGACPVWYAKDTASCLALLDQHEVAVMVATISSGSNGHGTLFKLLKQEYPELLTIVMAESADVESIIELINRAKIYRYLPMPCKPARLRYFIESALARVRRYRANPVLLRQEKAEPLPESEVSAGTLQVLGRIKSLRRLILPRVTGRSA